MTSGREKMILGRENCKNGREKKYKILLLFQQQIGSDIVIKLQWHSLVV